nr:glycosyltransferase family 8 protein [Oceanococcus sp. HetDA_MAG_MS8]
MDLACATDANYLPPCAAMIHSVLSNSPSHRVRVHLLHTPDVSPEDVSRLAEMIEFSGGSLHTYVASSDRLKGLPRLRFIPALMWYRIYLPELLSGIEKVLYLDCDALVTSDLTPVWQMSLEDYYLAAVDNVLPKSMASWSVKLGLMPGQRYFNSGVLLLNLELMRADGVVADLAAFGRARAAELAWPDQDALNKVLGGRRLALHPRWNCQNSFFFWPQRAREVLGESALREAVDAPGIVHFEGPGHAKPWHVMCQHPYTSEFRESWSSTPWCRTPWIGNTGLVRAVRCLPPSWQFPVYKRMARRGWVL